MIVPVDELKVKSDAELANAPAGKRTNIKHKVIIPLSIFFIIFPSIVLLGLSVSRFVNQTLPHGHCQTNIRSFAIGHFAAVVAVVKLGHPQFHQVEGILV